MKKIRALIVFGFKKGIDGENSAFKSKTYKKIKLLKFRLVDSKILTIRLNYSVSKNNSAAIWSA